MYYGKGFTHSDVYNMPTYLRKFYLREIIAVKEMEKKEISKHQNKNKQSYTPKSKI